MSHRIKLAVASACLLAITSGNTYADANINLVINNNPGEGFFDTSPKAPVFGNPGTTLGEQRILAFEAAILFWEEKIDSDVDIDVLAAFAPQTCNPTGAVLGSAGPRTVSRNFPNAPRADTFYYAALANSLAGEDQVTNALNPLDNNDIRTTFNSQLDAGLGAACLGGLSWDYRIDPPDPNSLTIAAVVLHELAHGLGFSTLTNGQTGAKFARLDDQFSLFLRDLNLNLGWPEMTNFDRAGSATSNGALVWDGPKAVAQSSFLTEGVNAGQPQMFAPTSFIPGSSVSHWDVALSPNELMEPRSVVPRENWLTLKAMYDMGWSGNPCIQSDLPNDQWVMFSLECLPPTGENTVQDILGDDIAGVYGTSWIVYEYNPEAAIVGGAYVALTPGSEMQLGTGYWLGQVDSVATVLDVPDMSSRTPSPVDCASNDTLNVAPDNRRSCFEVALRTTPETDGFTFLGNPFRRDIPLNDMRVVTDSGFCSTGCTFDEADLNGVVFPRLFAYDGATETYTRLASGDILPARMGAWSATMAGSDGLNPRLQIPR